MAEVFFYGAICRQRFVFEFFVVDEFCFVDFDVVEGEGVGRAGYVLGDDVLDAAVVPADDVVVVYGFDDWVFEAEFFRGPVPDDIMDVANPAHFAERGKSSG